MAQSGEQAHLVTPETEATVHYFTANGRHLDIALVVHEVFGRGCFIRDPAGNLIEFVEEDDWASQQ